MAAHGDVVFQAVNCTLLSVSTHGIILPPPYASGLSAGYLVYIKPAVTCTAQALMTSTLTNMSAILLTAGVWDICAVAVFGTASGINTGVTVVGASISTNSMRIPTMKVSFGRHVKTWFANWLTCTALTKITAGRIA